MCHIIYKCPNPLRNNKMMIENYLGEIEWRIAALFSTLAALFSLCVVLYYLIFRDNPNLPDNTDSAEKERFLNELNNEKYNLISEICYSIKNFTSFALVSRSNRSKNNFQNCFQRLLYVICGSNKNSDDSDEESQEDKSFLFKNSLDTENLEVLNETSLNGSKKNKSEKLSKKTSRSSMSGNQMDNNFKENKNRKFNSIRKLLGLSSKQKNENLNNNALTGEYNELNDNDNDKICRKTSLNRLQNKRNNFELNDKLLFEFNQNFEDLLLKNFADAWVTINYFKQKSSFSIIFYSIINRTLYDFMNVHVLIDIFFMNKWKRRLVSKTKPIEIKSGKENGYDQNFIIQFKDGMNLELIKINVFIVGNIRNNNFEKPLKTLSHGNILLTSKSSHPSLQILGGAHLVLKHLITK